MIYTKLINGRQVFSQCRSIRLEDGTWVSNPSREQILADGWKEYTPSEPPATPSTEPYTDDVFTAIRRMLHSSVEDLSDEEALSVASLFPLWIDKVGEQVNLGERLWYDENLYRVIQPHIVQKDWTPPTTPALFAVVSIEEWPEIPENIPSTAPWMKGDKGTWKGEHYICNLDNCVWNPDVAPSFWIKQ